MNFEFVIKYISFHEVSFYQRQAALRKTSEEKFQKYVVY